MLSATIFAIAYHMLVAHLPGGGELFINPAEVVALRTPPKNEGYLKEGVRCLVLTTDGKFLAITEACSVIQAQLEAVLVRPEDEP